MGSVALAVVWLLLGVVLVLVATTVYVATTGFEPDFDSADQLFGNPSADIAMFLGAIILGLPVALAAAWIFQRRRPGTLASVTGRLRWRWLAICCGLALPFCVISFAIAVWQSGFIVMIPAAGEFWLGWERFAGPVLIILFLVPLQSTAEEYLFRGWLLQAVGAYTLETYQSPVGRVLSAVFRTPWPGIIVASALFTVVHLYAGWALVDIFLFGVVAGWLAVLTGGIEASITFHMFTNLIVFLSPVVGTTPNTEQGFTSWQYVVIDIGMMLLYAAAAVLLAQRLRIQTVTPAPSAT